MSVPFGNFSAWDIRGNASGALIADTLSASAAFSYAERDGFTVNDVTGNDLDSRGAFSGKGQLLWKPARQWEARLIVSGERARDGDYAPQRSRRRCARTRSTPRATTRATPTATSSARPFRPSAPARSMRLSTTTGFVKWKTEDSTDLDYSPLPLVTRDNAEEDFQFTQEVRLASAAPTKLSDTAALKWQTGVFLFTQSYQQDAVNTYAPFVLSQFVAFPVNEYSPVSELDDFGLGVFGQGTVTLKEKLDLVAGAARRLREQERRPQDVLRSGDRAADGRRGRRQLLERLTAVRGRLPLARRSTASTARSRTASRPAGSIPRPQPAARPTARRTRGTSKAGLKTLLANGRVALNSAVFFIDWNDLQLNVPNLNVPGQIYIANVGGATSKGVEFDLTARPAPGVDVFGSLRLHQRDVQQRQHFGRPGRVRQRHPQHA